MWHVGSQSNDCKSQGKGKMEQDGIKATKAKDRQRWSKGIHQRQRQRNEHSQRRWQAPPITHDVLLIEKNRAGVVKGTRKNNSVMSSKTHSNKNERRSESTVECARQVGPASNQGQQEKGTSSESIRSLADGC